VWRRLLRAPTGSSGLLGTFAYMAPEQVTGGEIDGRSDLYAVGVFLYEILTGEYPFPVEPPAAALHHHVNTKPPHVLEAKPGTDPTLAALTQRLLEKDPLDRLQTAEEAFAYLTDDSTPSQAPSQVETSLPGQLFAPRFVAREDELTRLLSAVEDAEHGRGGLWVVEGPSGIGKSRMVKELRAKVRRRTAVLVGTCAPERGQPYLPIQGLLDEIEAIADRSPPEVVKKIVGRDAALVGAVSPRLARLGGPATAEHLEPSERKVRMHKAIVGVIGRLALTRPVLMVLEDVHWADSSTLELLWDLSRTLLALRPGGREQETVCPVTVVLTRRSLAEGPDASEPFIRRLMERGLVQSMTVGAMGREAVEEMARTMTGAHAVPPAMVDELVKGTYGRPLMVQEVLESWVADRTLERRGGAWHFRGQPLEGPAGEPGADDTQPPHTPPERASSSRAPGRRRGRTRARGADEVALSKLEPLSGAARLLLERLALLGRLLSSDLVSALAGSDEATFLDAMDELVRANLLVEDVSHDGVRYKFYHEGFREAVVRALAPTQKTELHAFVARALERAFRDRRTELAHVLARHFRAANQPDRAVRYLRRMAKAAAGRGDLDGALRRLEDAVAIVDERPRTRASATRKLQVLLQEIDLLLDFGLAKEALDRADPQVGLTARNPDALSAELLLRRARAQFALGRLDETLTTLMSTPRPAPTRSLGARFLELEGRARAARGEYEAAQAVLQAGHDIAREAGLEHLAEQLDAKVGVALMHQGRFAEARQKLEDGLAQARAREDQRSEADLLGHLGLVHAAQGHDAEAAACLREAIEMAEARGFRGDLERWSGELGRLLSDLGDAEAAQGHLTEALDLSRETGSRQGEAMWRAELGAHLLRVGELERAARELSRALAIAREIGARRSEGLAQIHLGALALEENYDSVDEALERVRAGLEIAGDLENGALETVGLIYLARVCRAQANRRRAREVLEQARRAARRTHDTRLKRRVQAEFDALEG
jgi:tetratricopeptide (TPR) repeat protein